MEYLQEIHKHQLLTHTKGHYDSNDAQHTETSTVPEQNTGINVTQQEQKQNSTLGITSAYVQNAATGPGPLTFLPTCDRYIHQLFL